MCCRVFRVIFKLEQLSETDVDEFIGDVYIELKHCYKTQNNGEILFCFTEVCCFPFWRAG